VGVQTALEFAQMSQFSINSHAEPRTGRDLINATVPFAKESTKTSWLHVGSTFAMLVAALVGAGMSPWWPVRLAFSLVAALLMVRSFIFYHDYMHRAILVRSRVAWFLFRVYSALSLTPPRSWKDTHNYHHGHVGQLDDSGVGAFPVMTTKDWAGASWTTKANYRITRHPLTVLAGYLTIFFFSLTLLPLLKDPARHWDSLLSLVGHVALIAVLWLLGGFSTAFYVMLLPIAVASTLGSYLFFAQHSYKGMKILPEEDWSYHAAALESSSFMQLSKVMHWFTGNIGFHHIHHLNVRIPFYRLPEAMDAIPELQSPVITTLKPRDILESFRCCLWDEDRQQTVTYRQAARLAA
jgi:omega-6 fatty acid desaturase (delta-12 desaturase)